MTLSIATQSTLPGQRDKALATRFFLSLPSIDIFKKTAANKVSDRPALIGKPPVSGEHLDRTASAWDQVLAAEKTAARPRVLEPMPVGSKGSTPYEMLLSASREGDLLTLDQLVRQGVNLDYKDENHNTALCIAAQHGHRHCASVLSKHTRTLNQRGSNKRTPIHIAAINGHEEIVQLLAMKGARLNVKDSKGSHCLGALTPEFINQLRSDIQQALNHLDGSREHSSLCKRFRSSIRAIDQYCGTR